MCLLPIKEQASLLCGQRLIFVCGEAGKSSDKGDCFCRQAMKAEGNGNWEGQTTPVISGVGCWIPPGGEDHCTHRKLWQGGLWENLHNGIPKRKKKVDSGNWKASTVASKNLIPYFQHIPAVSVVVLGLSEPFISLLQCNDGLLPQSAHFWSFFFWAGQAF